MHRVTVTVQRFGDPRTRELEVSDSVPGTRLARMISRALSWDLTTNGEYAVYQIEVLPLGRRLAPDESLASAGAWDGSWLILHAVGTEWQAEPDDDTEPVPTREQVWSTDLDPPTDIGVGQDRRRMCSPRRLPAGPTMRRRVRSLARGSAAPPRRTCLASISTCPRRYGRHHPLHHFPLQCRL